MEHLQVPKTKPNNKNTHTLTRHTSHAYQHKVSFLSFILYPSCSLCIFCYSALHTKEDRDIIFVSKKSVFGALTLLVEHYEGHFVL